MEQLFALLALAAEVARVGHPLRKYRASLGGSEHIVLILGGLPRRHRLEPGLASRLR